MWNTAFKKFEEAWYFLKAAFHKFYLVYSLILRLIFSDATMASDFIWLLNQLNWYVSPFLLFTFHFSWCKIRFSHILKTNFTESLKNFIGFDNFFVWFHSLVRNPIYFEESFHLKTFFSSLKVETIFMELCGPLLSSKLKIIQIPTNTGTSWCSIMYVLHKFGYFLRFPVKLLYLHI